MINCKILKAHPNSEYNFPFMAGSKPVQLLVSRNCRDLRSKAETMTNNDEPIICGAFLSPGGYP